MAKSQETIAPAYDPVAEARKTLRSYALCFGCRRHMLGIMKNPNGSPARSYCAECCNEGDVA